MLALMTLFRLVSRSYARASGLYGGPTIVPLPVPPFLSRPREAASGAKVTR